MPIQNKVILRLFTHKIKKKRETEQLPGQSSIGDKTPFNRQKSQTEPDSVWTDWDGKGGGEERQVDRERDKGEERWGA